MRLFKRKKSIAKSEPRPDIKPLGKVAERTDQTHRRSRGAVNKVLSGDVLVGSRTRRNYTLVLYFCLLILLYMSYIFHGQEVQRNELQQRMELGRVKAKALLYSSERIERTRHSNISAEVKRRGLDIREWATPPTIITAQKEDE